MPKQNQYIILTAIGSSHSGFIGLIAKTCLKAQCLIQESKMHCVGNDDAIVILVIKGAWHSLAKFEAALPVLEKKTNLSLVCKRTSFEENHSEGLRYQTQIFAEDRAGILSELCAFFNRHNMQVEAIEAHSDTQARSNTPMCTLDLTIRLPLKSHIATLRDKFLTFCEDRNFDASFEPFKLS